MLKSCSIRFFNRQEAAEIRLRASPTTAAAALLSGAGNRTYYNGQ